VWRTGDQPLWPLFSYVCFESSIFISDSFLACFVFGSIFGSKGAGQALTAWMPVLKCIALRCVAVFSLLSPFLALIGISPERRQTLQSHFASSHITLSIAFIGMNQKI
jgi:hypothetical protein